MPFTPEFNYLAIAAAAVAYFVVGFVWYTPLFGKVWAKHMGFDADADVKPAEMGKSMVLNLIGNLIIAFVLAMVLEGFTERAWTAGGAERTMALGLQVGGWVWLGFFVPKELSGVAWEKHSWTVFGINAGYQLVGVLAMAAVLTAWM